MPKPSNTAYGDEVSDDEEAELNKLMGSGELPPPDDQPGQTTGDDDGDAGTPPPPPPPPPPAQEPPAAEGDQPGDGDQPGQTDDEKLAAFLEKHKGKSPEEIARLAFQQSQRANRAEFDGRKAAQQLTSTLDRIREARDARTAAIEAKRTAFKEKLEKDPDAALLEARSAQLSEEERQAVEEAEAAEFSARAQAAVDFASAVIPEFETRAPIIRAFGQELGFQADELAQVVDGRQIVTLHLAAIAGNMIKAGLIDPSGRFLQLPQAVENIDQGKGAAPSAPRQPFGRAPARGAGTQKSLADELADIANMSDEELDKLDPVMLEKLLRDAEVQ